VTSVAALDFVSLDRGACFGTCPDYEITLRADGTAQWHGRNFVDRAGQWDGAFSPAEFSKLAAFMRRCGFFDWDDEYVDTVTDLPTYVITAKDGSSAKSVLQYATDEPADFWVVATLIDAIATSGTWSPDSESMM
jgi:hypothetical protein